MPNLARLPWWRRWFGNRSERAAARYLKKRRYKILARNYLSKFGELDLVALDGQTIVFVEVRSTGNPDVERVTHSVDWAKQRRLTRLAVHFLQQHKLEDRFARFDVLIVLWLEGTTRPEITHYINAFEAVD